MRTTIIFFIIFFCVPAIGFSATIKVPSQYPTIQDAIDAASGRDTVLVAPGTYVENINFIGKAITVTSEQGPAVTIIENGGVTCNYSGPDSVLDGFTIYHGGGMIIEAGNPTVTNCTFSENEIGMYNFGSNPMVTNCTFSENEIGMYNTDFSNPTVTNCIFIKNFVGFWSGGGMYNWNSSPTVTNCTFIENKAGGQGGGMGNWGGSPTVMNCTFIKNKAPGGNGGGMANWGSSPTVTNCTFIGNEAGGTGGGMYNWNSSPTVTNCILWNNQHDQIVGSDLVTHSCVQGGYPGTGNIDTDPLFVDPLDGDFHLTFPSPCKDTGDNSIVTELYDFEGDPRIAYGTVDIGADEFYTHLYWTGEATPGGNVALKFVGLPGTMPVQLWLGSGVMDPPMPTIYGDWFLQFPLLANVWLGSIPSPKGVLEFPFTFPANTPTPLSLPFQAGVGMELTNLCILEVK